MPHPNDRQLLVDCRYVCERYDTLMKHQGLTRGHGSVFRSKLSQRAQLILKPPHQVTRERNRMHFQRNKARLEKMMVIEMAHHVERKDSRESDSTTMT